MQTIGSTNGRWRGRGLKKRERSGDNAFAVGHGEVTRRSLVGLEVREKMKSIQIQVDLRPKTRARDRTTRARGTW